MKKLKIILVSILILFFSISINSQTQFNFAKAWKGQTNEAATCLVEDNNGNIYVGGVFRDTVDFDPTIVTNKIGSKGSDDGFISKFDANGNYLWTRTIEGTSSESVTKLKINASSELVVLGEFSGVTDFDPSLSTQTITSNGSKDIYLARFDLNGNYIDVKQIGGNGTETAMNLTFDQNGDIFICGAAATGCDFDPGIGVNTPTFTNTGFIAKYTASMGLLFVANNIGEFATNVMVNNNNDIIVGGYFQGIVDFDNSPTTYSVQSVGQRDVFICKYTNTGNFSWLYNVGSVLSDHLTDMAIDNNYIYGCGSFNNTVDFDNSAGTYTLQSNGQRDAFLIKLNHTGNLQFAYKFGNTLNDAATSVITNSNGCTVALFTNGIIDCDPGASTSTITTNYSSTILEFNNSGNFISKQQVGEANPYIYSYQILKNTQNQLYIAGFIDNNPGDIIDFDDSPAVSSYTCGGNGDAILVKYNPITTSIINHPYKLNVSVYPNPSSNQVHVVFSDENYKFTLFDSKLSVIQRGQLSAENPIINIEKLNAGLYFLKSEKGEILKFIKE